MRWHVTRMTLFIGLGLATAACTVATPMPSLPTTVASPTATPHPTSTVAPTVTPLPPAPPPLPPRILHSLTQREDCLGCHGLTARGGPRMPLDHALRTNVVCLGCHAVGAEFMPSPTLTTEGGG